MHHMQESNLNEKNIKLKEILKGLESVVVAFSGGVDSTFLLKVSLDVLGGDNVIATTARSATYSEEEYREAVRLAGELKARHITVWTEELKDENFSSNPPERCYYCKRELFSRLKKIAGEKGKEAVVDGANLDDKDDHRPGMRAAGELGIHSPLLEAGLRKDDIRILSGTMGLQTSEKPSYACLASRFPYGERIKEEKLKRVDEAERFLRSLGFEGFRVRSHDSIARIEVNPGKDFDRIFEKRIRDKIIKGLKDMGYVYITLDLEGYRTGSMNEVLSKI